MTAAEYALKRAAGRCTWGKCRAKATHGILCRNHKAKHKRSSKRLDKRRYLERKLAGICVTKSCDQPAREDAVHCVACTTRHAQEQARYLATTAGKAVRTKYRRRRAAQRFADGLCRLCNEPRVTTLCQAHREESQQRWRRLTGRPPNMKERCSLCKTPGHRASSCTGLRPLPPLTLEEFALRREAA